MPKKITEAQQACKHFKGFVNKEVKDYVRDVVLEKSRYLFIVRENGNKTTHCTHCKKSHKTDELIETHNATVICPHCNSECIVKDTRYRYSTLRDVGFEYYFKKSKLQEDIIICTFLKCIRDYGHGYQNVKTNIVEYSRYYFSPDKALQLFQNYYNDDWAIWYRGKELRQITSGWDAEIPYRPVSFNYDSLDLALNDSPFFSRVKDYIRTNLEYGTETILRMGLYCDYPKIEYICKLPLRTLMQTYARGFRTYSTINWRAKTIHGFLKVSKQCYKEINHMNLSFEQLRWIQSREKHNQKWDEEDVAAQGNIEITHPIITQLSTKKITNYLLAQKEAYDLIYNDPYNEHGAEVSTDQIYRDWADYLNACTTLGYDTQFDRVIRPKDLITEHNEATALVLYKEDEKLKEKEADRFEKLSKRYKFERLGFVILAPKTQSEIINEGKILRHCVGGYAKRHFEGDTNILFVRRADKPEQPFFTMEIINKEIKQCRGYLHGKTNLSYEASGNKKLINFIKIFEKQKLRRAN